MKVLVLNGSPKKKSDTMVLTNAFLEGLNKNMENEIKVIDVIDKKVGPCTGCFSCFKTKSGRCAFNDDMNSILDDIIASDVIIYSFPLYCYSFPSHLKAVIDRLLPLTTIAMKKEGDYIHHVPLYDMSKKHFLAISGCGFPNWTNNFLGLKIQLENLFRHNLTMVFVSETPMLNVPEAKEVVDPLLEKFRLAGEEYNDNLIISYELIKELETPMIPMDMYIDIVNSQNK